MYNYDRALVLAPHTDDGEFGCGGTIRYLLERGSRVIYVAFSAAEDSLPKGLNRETLRSEVIQAVNGVLDVPKEDIIVYNYKVRYFHENRQLILNNMIELRNQFSPNVVLLPSMHDTHQDHSVITQEGFRAFKNSTMLGYEMPWNNLSFITSCFTVLTAQQLEKKIQAVECYKSQQHKSYASRSFVKSLAKVRGVQINREYAEAFELIRLVVE